MPYIVNEDRIRYIGGLAKIDGAGIPTPGHLNYLLSTVTDIFIGLTPNYEKYNAAIGALESAKLELYRRMIAPYEDGKIASNGDVYEKR